MEEAADMVLRLKVVRMQAAAEVGILLVEIILEVEEDMDLLEKEEAELMECVMVEQPLGGGGTGNGKGGDGVCIIEYTVVEVQT